MKYDSFFPFHVTPIANGWAIDERTKWGATIKQRIMEFNDKDIADYVCDRLNIWARDNLNSKDEDFDGFCDYIYQAGYDRGVKDQRFFLA